MNMRDFVSEHNEEALIADGLDEAIIGVVSMQGKYVACYDVNSIIDILMEDGMSEEDAWEYFEFNIEGAYMGEYTPVYLLTPEEDDYDS